MGSLHLSDHSYSARNTDFTPKTVVDNEEYGFEELVSKSKLLIFKL